MVSIKKLENAIFYFLSETLDNSMALDESKKIALDIAHLIEEINFSLKEARVYPKNSKVHHLKNLLLYGDFYYEADICEELEIETRSKGDIDFMVACFDSLIKSLEE